MSFLETISVTRVSDTQKYLEMELYQITFNLGFLFKSLCVSVLYQVCLQSAICFQTQQKVFQLIQIGYLVMFVITNTSIKKNRERERWIVRLDTRQQAFNFSLQHTEHCFVRLIVKIITVTTEHQLPSTSYKVSPLSSLVTIIVTFLFQISPLVCRGSNGRAWGFAVAPSPQVWLLNSTRIRPPLPTRLAPPCSNLVGLMATEDPCTHATMSSLATGLDCD